MLSQYLKKVPFFLGNLIITLKGKDVRMPGRISPTGKVSIGGESGTILKDITNPKDTVNIRFELPKEYLDEQGGNTVLSKEYFWPWQQTTDFWRKFKQQAKIVDVIRDSKSGNLVINHQGMKAALQVVEKLETRFVTPSSSRVGIKQMTVKALRNDAMTETSIIHPSKDYFQSFTYNLQQRLNGAQPTGIQRHVVIVDSRYSDEFKSLEATLKARNLCIDEVVEKNTIQHNEHDIFDIQVAMDQYSTKATPNDIIVIIEKLTSSMSTDHIELKLSDPVLHGQVATLRDAGIKTIVCAATEQPVDGGKIEIIADHFVTGSNLNSKVAQILAPTMTKGLSPQ